MEQTPAPTAAHAPVANKWLIAVAVMLATILEVLDMTIANVALDHIRGSLSAGVDEAAWVMTSYIIGTAIVIPLTGWLSSVFGRKRFFLFCIAAFTVSSLFCGAAPNLESLVFFRVVQGLSGGVMMPLSQAILMETFSAREQPMAMAVWGLGMMIGPILGPIVGGWITDNYSWRWIFYINIPMGGIAFFLLAATLSRSPLHQARADAYRLVRSHPVSHRYGMSASCLGQRRAGGLVRFQFYCHS